MPLNVHPSSTCDICMDPFVVPGHGEELSKAPHAISCGHIFCRSCLLNIHPSEGMDYPACPHCRKLYRRDKVKPLFVALDPDCDKPAPEGVSRALQRVNAATSSIRRVEGEILSHDLSEAVDNVHKFTQTYPSPDLPVERLFDAFASVLEKYADKSRQLSDSEYRDRRHTLDDQEENTRNKALEESYLDEIQALQNELSRLKQLSSQTIHQSARRDAPPFRSAQKQQHIVAISGVSTDAQDPVLSVREEVRRKVQAQADLRIRRSDVELPARGDAIEQGNALGLGEEHSVQNQNRYPSATSGRLLFEGRIVEREDHYRGDELTLGRTRRAEQQHTRRASRLSQNIPEHAGASSYLHRRARSASASGRPDFVDETSNQDESLQRSRVDFYGEEDRSRRSTVSESRRSQEHRSRRDGRTSRHVQYDIPLNEPQARLGGHSSLTVHRAHATGTESSFNGELVPRIDLASHSGRTLEVGIGHPPAMSMVRTTSLQTQPVAVVDSEYVTPRISAPVTPRSNPSAQPTPLSSSSVSLNASPNVTPYASIHASHPQRSPHPGSSALAPAYDSFGSAYAHGLYPADPSGISSPNPPPDSTIPITLNPLHGGSSGVFGAPAVHLLRIPATAPVRRNDTLLF